MENRTMHIKLSSRVISLYESITPRNEFFFLILFAFYEAFHFYLKIKWNDNVDVDFIRVILVGIILWGSAFYLLYSIAEWGNLWKKNAFLVTLGLVFAGAAGFFLTKMSTNSFDVVFDMFFCLMVVGKDYKKILRNTMWIGIGTLLFCFLGMLVDITKDIEKPYNVHPGHSLGTVYPNTWGYLVFLILLIFWYLYLRRRSVWHEILTFAAFWGASVFMYFYICCRTIAGLAIVFPVFTVLVDWLEKQADANAEKKLETIALEEEKKKKAVQEKKQSGRSGKNSKKAPSAVFRKTEQDISADTDQLVSVTKKRHERISRFFEWLVISIPYAAFTLVMILSSQVEWMHDHFYYTKLHNLAMRFVQGGLYFRTYGIPLAGNPYDASNYTYVDVNGDFLEVGILDSSYASYIIMRGILWVLLCMLWLTFAEWKALKKRDFAIPLLSLFILGYAMMERPGLELWYNFILLYPLAKVMSKPGTQLVESLPEATRPPAYKNLNRKNKKRKHS